MFWQITFHIWKKCVGLTTTGWSFPAAIGPFWWRARARQLIAHHESRLGQLLDAGVPLTTSDAMALLFPFELTDHEIYFASCEARAHLNHLVTRTKMTKSTKDGIAFFSPNGHGSD